MAFHGGGGGDYYPSDFYRSDEWEPHNVQAYGAGEQPDGAPFRGSPVGPGRLASAWCRQRRSLICVHAFACRQRVAAGVPTRRPSRLGRAAPGLCALTTARWAASVSMTSHHAAFNPAAAIALLGRERLPKAS